MAQSLFNPFANDTGQALFDVGGAEGGLRAGAFDVRAAAGLSLGFDDNVYATPAAVRSDALANGLLVLRAKRETATQDLLASAHVDARRYQRETSQNADQYGFSGDLAQDFGGRDRLGLRLDVARRIESRTDIEAPLQLSPYDDLRGAIEYGHVFNRLSAQLRAEGARLQYLAAGQDFRDRWQYRAELTPAVVLGARLQALAVMYFNRDDFDSNGARDASADTRGALLGARYESPEVFSLEAAAGFFERRAKDRIDDLDGLAARARLTWQPTRFTQIEAGALRTDAPTRVPGAFVKIRSDAHLGLMHSYSNSLSLRGGVRYQQDVFDSLDRTDRAWIVETGCVWALTRRLLIDLRYQFSLRDTQDGARDFDRQIARLTWVWRS